MKKQTIQLTYYEYMNLYQILHSVKHLLERKRYVLQGTKSIRPDLIAVAMLNNRNLFLYDPTKTFEKHGRKRDFKFDMYQMFALKYLLEDIVDCPLALADLKSRVAEIVKPFEYKQVQTDFQKYFEEHWKEAYDVTYTEMIDEIPSLYEHLMNEFLIIESDLELV